METISQLAANLRHEWETDPRWAGVERTYSAEDVIRLRGSVQEEFTLARRGANRLWQLLHSQEAVRALGALTGNQAVQMVKDGDMTGTTWQPAYEEGKQVFKAILDSIAAGASWTPKLISIPGVVVNAAGLRESMMGDTTLDFMNGRG